MPMTNRGQGFCLAAWTLCPRHADIGLLGLLREPHAAPGLQRPHQSDKAAPRLLGLECKTGIEVMGNDIRTKKEQDTHLASPGQIF